MRNPTRRGTADLLAVAESIPDLAFFTSGTASVVYVLKFVPNRQLLGFRFGEV